MVKKILLGILTIIVVVAAFLGYQITNALGTFAAGNDSQYDLENLQYIAGSPLEGKKIIYLGSSVTDGMSAGGTSFVDYIAKRDNVDFIKEAVSGTTLIDDSEKSYVSRMKTIDPAYDADMIVVQLSTNDASQGLPLGEIADNKDIESFDTTTITGAIEYIIGYSQQTWNAPIVFYTGTYYEDASYSQMVARLHQIAEKWDVGVIDMYNDEELNDITEEERELYMNDGTIHPTKAGYLEWWTPFIEEGLIENL